MFVVHYTRALYRNRFMKQIAVALSALSLGIFSCTEQGGQTSHQRELELDTLVYHELFTLGGGFREQQLEVDIQYIYPINDSLLAKTLASKFFPDSLLATTSHPDSLLAGYSEALYRDFTTDIVEEVEGASEYFDHNWCIKQNNDILYSDKYIASVGYESYSYFGGAHGISTINTLSIDRSTGRPLEEGDLFVEGYEAELAQIIVERLMALHGVSSPQDLKDYGYFDPSEISPNNNFYLTNTDMVYTFNQYEIAPYANGRIEVSIPLDLLGQLIRLGSILEHYV